MSRLTLGQISGLRPCTLGTFCDLNKIKMGQAAKAAYEKRAEREHGFPFSGEISERIRNPQLAGILLTAHPSSMHGPALAELRRMVYYTEIEPGVLELLRNSARDEPSFAFDSAGVEKAIGFNRDLEQDVLGEVEEPFAEAFSRLGADLFVPYRRNLSEQEAIGEFQATGDEQYLIWAVREHIHATSDESAVVNELGEYLDLFTGAGEWGSRNFSAVALLKMNPWQVVLAYRRGQWLCQKFGRQYKELLLACASLPQDELSGNLNLFIRDFVPQDKRRELR